MVDAGEGNRGVNLNVLIQWGHQIAQVVKAIISGFVLVTWRAKGCQGAVIA